MTARMIINADDFGLCEGVNKAVAEAHNNGVLTSATIMANMPGLDEAVEIAKSTPRLGVGVHLNLTEGPSLSLDYDAAGRLISSNSEVMRLSAMTGNSNIRPIRLQPSIFLTGDFARP